MTSLATTSPPLRPRLPRLLIAGGALAAALCGWAPSEILAQGAVAESVGVRPALEPDTALAQALVREGLENVTAERGPDGVRLGIENRRYRHSATAFGIASRLAAGPSLVFERRLGLPAAAVWDSGGEHPTRVLYPSDGDFPAPPAGLGLSPTRGKLDVILRPLIAYEFGHLHDAVRLRLEVEPGLYYNPWPGGRARLGVVVPILNDFPPDTLRPDVDRVRPGTVTLEQYAWAPGAALLSGTAGLLGNNRYGLSLGIARPLGNGRILLDGQVDITGFIAFADSGTTYSTPSLWTGFAAVTYRPRDLDLALKVRAAKFLFGDRGVEIEMRRSFGDLDVGFFALRTYSEDAFTISGFRLGIPIPPRLRPVRRTVRVLPTERLPVDFFYAIAPVGRSLSNVASREDHLRQLNPSSLAAKRDRYLVARGERPPLRTMAGPPNVSLVGMTGFVNTPWAGIIGDREAVLGFSTIPKSVAYDQRGNHRNDAYYVALGFIPRVEVGVRLTTVPGFKAFIDDVPDVELSDSDRMFSARVSILTPRLNRPGLAIGIEDARGTRRFHSTYVVAGVPTDIYHLQTRLSLGYAPSVFEATRHTLNGVFGAVEVSPWRRLALSLEHDTEKLNAMFGVNLGFGFQARVAVLDLGNELKSGSAERVGFGAGWWRLL